MTWMEWYNNLAKPAWTPAPATIGLIWQILYPVIFISFGYVFVQTFRGKVGWLVALPFAINLVANLIFTPIQFGMRNLPLAAVDILVVWATIIWCVAAAWPPPGHTSNGLPSHRGHISCGCRWQPCCNCRSLG
jgi:translocator protein